MDTTIGRIASITFALLLIWLAPSAAQPWQSVGGDLYAVHASGELIVAVGQRGQIMRSTDAGETWTLPYSTLGFDLHDVDFFDATTGLIVADDGLILRTTDAGVTWSRFGLIGGETGLMIDLVDASRGYLATRKGEVRRTTDRGATWRVLRSAGGGAVHQIEFATPAIGVIVADSGRVWRTADSGITWVPVLNDPQIDLWDIELRPDGSGIGVQAIGAILKTTDHGATWSTGGTMTDAVMATSVAIGDDGTIVVGGSLGSGDARTIVAGSTDGGLTWTPVPIGFVASSTSFAIDIALIDGRRLVAVGSPGLMVTSGNDGRLQAESNAMLGDVITGPARLENPAFASRDTAVIANDILADGGWIRTTDGGITWTYNRRSLTKLREAHFFSETDGLFVGDDLEIHPTNDAGFTLSYRASTATPAVRDVWDSQFLTPTLGFAAADNAVLRTTDGGATWTGRIVSADGIASDVQFLDDRIGFAVVNRPASQQDTIPMFRVARTDDGGETWNTILRRSGWMTTLMDVVFVDPLRGFVPVAGSSSPTDTRGLIYSTTDGGLTWDSLSTGDRQVTDIAFFNDRQGYAIGVQRLMLATSDAGRTWREDTVAIASSLDRFSTIISISLSKDRRTLIATGRGMILRKVLDEPIVAGVPHAAAIGGPPARVRAVPNPAGAGSVTIEIGDAVASGDVALVTLFDIDGRMVRSERTAVRRLAGALAVDANVGGLAAGSYMASVAIGDRRASCLVIIR